MHGIYRLITKQLRKHHMLLITSALMSFMVLIIVTRAQEEFKQQQITTLIRNQRQRLEISKFVQKVREDCESMSDSMDTNLILTAVNENRIQWDLQKQLFYCPLGYADVQSLSEYLRNFGSSIHSQLYNGSRLQIDRLLQLFRLDKLLVVRHPFQRLVSAYLEENSSYPVPFTDFTSKVLTSTTCDIRWCPAFERCLVCDLLYNLVIKYERLSNFLPFLADRFKLPPPDDSASVQVLPEAQVESLIRTLRKETYQMLLNYYEMDFRLFDYDFFLDGESARSSYLDTREAGNPDYILQDNLF